jgi:hypothetical protein
LGHNVRRKQWRSTGGSQQHGMGGVRGRGFARGFGCCVGARCKQRVCSLSFTLMRSHHQGSE